MLTNTINLHQFYIIIRFQYPSRIRYVKNKRFSRAANSSMSKTIRLIDDGNEKFYKNKTNTCTTLQK